ncbi:MAG: recombinase family protein [Pseudonocardiaceae bacterium]
MLSGYARCSIDERDLTVERLALLGLGVAEDRIYLDKGLPGTNRVGPGPAHVLAAVGAGEVLVAKLDRLARSVPDARDIGDSLIARGVRLSLGGTIYDPSDPVGKMFVIILATLRRVRGRPAADAFPRGHGRRGAIGRLWGRQPKLSARRQARIAALQAAGEHSVTDLAELLSVSGPAAYRVLERVGGWPAAGGGAEGRQHRG